MHARQPLPLSLGALSVLQGGVVSTRQIRACGVTEKVSRRHSAEWTRLAHGLWCTGEVTWVSMAYAGLLRGGPDATLGGLAAAHLWGVLGTEPQDLTIWTPQGACRSPIAWPPWRVRFRQGTRLGRGEPSRTPIEATILDAAHESDEDTTVAVLTGALANRLTFPARVLDAADGQRVRHRRVIEQLCDASAAGIESALEFRYHTEVEAAHALPPCQRQVSLSPGTRSDGYYPEFGVVIELDGRRGHEHRHRDMARDNRHALLGRGLTLRYGWHDVLHRPCEVALQVGQALRERGWLGVVKRCRRCRRLPLRDFRP